MAVKIMCYIRRHLHHDRRLASCSEHVGKCGAAECSRKCGRCKKILRLQHEANERFEDVMEFLNSKNWRGNAAGATGDYMGIEIEATGANNSTVRGVDTRGETPLHVLERYELQRTWSGSTIAIEDEGVGENLQVYLGYGTS